jgi:hypothetical protein
MTIERVAIDDDLSSQNRGGIGVTVHLTSGERRWCFFMTPDALSRCGDWIGGTATRFHYGAAHMIVIAGMLTPGIIEEALRQIDNAGHLDLATLRIDE